MDHAFDSWHEPDLLEFLRTWAGLGDRNVSVSAEDVRAVLDITTADATAALNRLRALNCLEDQPGPRRNHEGVLDLARQLTGVGVAAVIDQRLPRPTR